MTAHYRYPIHPVMSFLAHCFVLLSVLTLAGCQPQSAQPIQHKQLFTFGTLIDITILDEDQTKAEHSIELISQEFDRLHSLWHPFNGGTLTQLNQRLSQSRPYSTPASIIRLIEQSQTLSVQSEGLFNPAIGQLIKLWQFDQMDNDTHQFTLPTPQAIDSLLKQKPSMKDISITPSSTPGESLVHSQNPAVFLDFGAFAKGVAIEQMIEKLKQQQINSALINAGGDLKVLGTKAGTPWRIGIKNPDHSLKKSHQPVLAAINLNTEEALFTSGNYERFFEHNGQRYHHIIDPGKGYPARGTRSVTVLSHDAGLADAASTALFIAGPERLQEIAFKLGIEHVMLIDDDDRMYLTPAMAERIELLTDTKPVVIKL